MAQAQKHGLVRGFTSGERMVVDSLAALCNRTESLDLPGLSGDEAASFLWYEHDALVGVAGVGDEEVPEAWIMVHPEHRRRGIGSTLLAAVRSACSNQGVGHCLLVCDEASPSGPAFVRAAGAQHAFSEYRMALDPARIDHDRPRDTRLVLRSAGANDLNVIAEITCAAFGDPATEVLERVKSGLADQRQSYYLATLDCTPIGTLRTSDHGTIFVTAFAVLPEFQGRGYGRQMLTEAVVRLLARGHRDIQIEVETENRNALGLYRACGFHEATTYGYYRLDVAVEDSD